MVIINQNQYITFEQMNLINDFRALWTEMVVWLRSFMISTITGFGDLDSISKRLYRIPVDFRVLLQPFLGAEQAEQFARLLSTFLLHAQTLITAQKNLDQQAVDENVVALYKDMDHLADFLARSNPYWNKGQWQNLFYQLNELGISEIVALFAADHDKEMNIRDRLLKHALLLGDYMASGVMRYLTPENIPTA